MNDFNARLNLENGQAPPRMFDFQSQMVNNDKLIQPPVMPSTSRGTGSNIDNEFFHITCHIELGLKQKIERGEFVELERLLPRDGNKRKISSVRKWEQAFRLYTAIYSRANPHRVAEIWQYVYVINLAATSYTWDNVASYDYTFRQLMSEYPDRSWALIYNQMWNLAMRDPISRGGGVGAMSFQSNKTRSGNEKV